MVDLLHVALPTGESVLADFIDSEGHTKQANQLRGIEPVLRLWLLTQNGNSCIVADYDEPCGRDWTTPPADVTAACIGVAIDGIEPGIVLSSYNAG